ncbi:DUF4232 domain-containing protein [Streptomyces sp. NPDC046821]|uniref:DUF4232 domain-containing protein n=1 Tax=Streptomyces sp. NPDC046821 TaxID=3154702 RepID=UPI0033F87C62
MLVRTVLAASAAALLVSAPTGPADATPAATPEVCAENALTLRATPSGQDNVLYLTVKNHTKQTCLVDSIPLIAYGNLDGAAVPYPPSGDAPYTLEAGKTAHAAVRSVSLSGGDARSVGYIVVAANPEHNGSKFSAASLGEPHGLRVWEPLTTLWQPTRVRADEVLAEADGAGILKV